MCNRLTIGTFSLTFSFAHSMIKLDPRFVTGEGLVPEPTDEVQTRQGRRRRRQQRRSTPPPSSEFRRTPDGPVLGRHQRRNGRRLGRLPKSAGLVSPDSPRRRRQFSDFDDEVLAALRRAPVRSEHSAEAGAATAGGRTSGTASPPQSAADVQRQRQQQRQRRHLTNSNVVVGIAFGRFARWRFPSIVDFGRWRRRQCGATVSSGIVVGEEGQQNVASRQSLACGDQSDLTRQSALITPAFVRGLNLDPSKC